MKHLHIDLETRSACDLRKYNAFIYGDDPTTDVWCAAWAFGDDEPVLWHPGDPCPPEIVEHVTSGGIIAAWNAAFEKIIWSKILGPKYGWPVPEPEQYRCVMVMSYALGMPGKLEHAAPALGLDSGKDMAGSSLMLRMAKPRKTLPTGELIWWDEPEKLKALGLYGLRDVETEQACYKRLLALRPSEQQVWFFDQRMNDRGIFVDAELCNAASKIIEKATELLNAAMREATDGHVRGITNAADLIRFCKDRGVETASVAKDELAGLLLRSDLPPDVRKALEIRQEGAKTSTAKVKKLLDLRQADGRMRGNLQYHGASTGRWSARGAQLQNLPRPSIKITPDVIDDVLRGDATWVELMHGPAMSVVSDCIRSMIAAPPGRKIVAADFSQIEARVTAWLSGQSNVLDAFSLADRKLGPDIYIAEAAGIYRVPAASIGKDDDRRQVGKVAILSLGFQGGAMALMSMASAYRLDMADVYPSIWEIASEGARESAMDAWEQRGKASGSDEKAWVASELVKIAWRAANPATVAMWKECEQAAMAAVADPGSVHHAGRLRYRVAGSWLFCRLPSGRATAYAYPKTELREVPWEDQHGNPAKVRGLAFMAVDSFTRKWSKQGAYGGLLFQNAVQGAARDVMVEALMRAEAVGYDPVMSIHDEGIFEADEGFGSAEELCAIMREPPVWAAGLPIAAEGFEAKRYRK